MDGRWTGNRNGRNRLLRHEIRTLPSSENRQPDLKKMKSILFTTLFFSSAFLAGCQGAVKTTDSPMITTRQGVVEMSPAEARLGTDAAYSQFIDVRTPEEYAAGHAYRAKNIPLDTLRDNLDKLEKNEPVYVICQTGRRSKEAAEILNAAGFPQVISITGGTDAWRDAGLPMSQ